MTKSEHLQFLALILVQHGLLGPRGLDRLPAHEAVAEMLRHGVGRLVLRRPPGGGPPDSAQLRG